VPLKWILEWLGKKPAACDTRSFPFSLHNLGDRDEIRIGWRRCSCRSSFRNSALAQAVIEDPGYCAAVQEPGALAFYYSNNDVPNGSPCTSVAIRLREHFLDGRRHACECLAPRRTLTRPKPDATIKQAVSQRCRRFPGAVFEQGPWPSAFLPAALDRQVRNRRGNPRQAVHGSLN
jgi:hypothetical protein